MTMIPNRPTAEGRQMGAELARLFEGVQAKVLARFPNHKTPCSSCAYRRGTVPNGCEETVMDALKAAVERVPFFCHMDLNNGAPQTICAGWAILQSETPEGIEAPWPFSHETEGDA